MIVLGQRNRSGKKNGDETGPFITMQKQKFTS